MESLTGVVTVTKGGRGLVEGQQDAFPIGQGLGLFVGSTSHYQRGEGFL